LMPPSLRDWVPEGHLVWTVLDAVEELDLAAIYADYRDDGRGRPAYEPSMMACAQPVVATRCAVDFRGWEARIVLSAAGVMRLSSWRLARRAGRNGDSRARVQSPPPRRGRDGHWLDVSGRVS